MKLLVSNYDNTLYTNGINLKLNILALKKFMKTNVFAISTGRNFVSIKKEIDRHKIPYNYVMCNDGSIAFDKNGRKIFADYLDLDDVVNMSEYFSMDPRIKKINYYGDFDKQVERRYVVELEVFTHGSNEFLEDDIASMFPHIRLVRFPCVAYLKNDFSKSDGIRELIDRNNMSIDSVHTIGDSFNDYEMLRDYDGYRMKKSHDLLHGMDIPEISQVHQLVKKLERK